MTQMTLGHSAELLMEKIVDLDNLAKAWQNVRSNHGAPDPDGITIDEFPDRCREHWPTIRQHLLEGTYDPSPAQRVAQSIERYLTRRLKLVVNHQKIRVCETDGVEFVGFTFEGYGGQIRVSPKNRQKFKDRVREITRRNRGVSMSRRLVELRRYFQGWVGYFSIVPIKTFFVDLDKSVRRRLRSCYWKQWRGPRTRIANLRKLGIRKDEAVTHGASSKGPWVMSSSQAVQEALSIDYLTGQGLVSLFTIWQKLSARK